METNQSNLDIFWQFIAERHLIYKRKNLEGLSSPWTLNKILSEFKFTNVFRDIDPWTAYVIKNIIPKCKSLSNLIFNLVIYRLYNKIDTFEHIWIQNEAWFDRAEFERRIRQIRESWKPVFTNAFIVSWYSFLSSEWDKIARTAKIIDMISKEISQIAINIEEMRSSENSFKMIKALRWIWDFLAYQICVDLWYARKDLFDEDIFVIAWPGCKRWLDRIFIDKWSLSYEECIMWLEENQENWFKRLEVDMEKLFDDRETKRLNLMSLENCLCEFSKYMKALNSEWRPRNRYGIRD